MGREGVLDPSSRQDGASPSWQTRGLCAGQPDRWFFPTGSGQATNHAYAKGRRVCARCPVRDLCLADAMRMERGLSLQFRHGMWGGMTPEERVELMRRTA